MPWKSVCLRNSLKAIQLYYDSFGSNRVSNYSWWFFKFMLFFFQIAALFDENLKSYLFFGGVSSSRTHLWIVDAPCVEYIPVTWILWGFTVFPVGILLSPSTEFHGSPWISKKFLWKKPQVTHGLWSPPWSLLWVSWKTKPSPPERLGKPPKKGGLVRNSSQIPWIQVGIMTILSMHHPGSTMLRERMCHVLGDPIPGNLIHDLLFHDRWRSLNHCNGVTIHHPKKGRQQNCQVRIAR